MSAIWPARGTRAPGRLAPWPTGAEAGDLGEPRRAFLRERRLGRFLLGGSSAADLLAAGRASALAGRCAVLEVGPLAIGELEGRPRLEHHAARAPQPITLALTLAGDDATRLFVDLTGPEPQPPCFQAQVEDALRLHLDL